MELIALDFSLMIWSLFAAISLVLLLITLVLLFQKHTRDKMTLFGWLLVIIFIPLIGPIMYMIYLKKMSHLRSSFFAKSK